VLGKFILLGEAAGVGKRARGRTLAGAIAIKSLLFFRCCWFSRRSRSWSSAGCTGTRSPRPSPSTNGTPCSRCWPPAVVAARPGPLIAFNEFTRVFGPGALRSGRRARTRPARATESLSSSGREPTTTAKGEHRVDSLVSRFYRQQPMIRAMHKGRRPSPRRGQRERLRSRRTRQPAGVTGRPRRARPIRCGDRAGAADASLTRDDFEDRSAAPRSSNWIACSPPR